MSRLFTSTFLAAGLLAPLALSALGGGAPYRCQPRHRRDFQGSGNTPADAGVCNRQMNSIH